MARRVLPAAVALTASAVLLLSACGGESAKDPDGIKGADKGASDSAKPSPSDGASGDSGRPDIGLPDEVTMTVDKGQPSEPGHAAARDDAFRYIRALRHGIVEQDPEDPAYRYYSVGPAADYARRQIEEWIKGGWTPTGTDRYYDTETAAVGSTGKGVLVTFCRDQSRSFSRSLGSKKVHRTKESLKSYQKYSLLMRESKSSPGVWQAGGIEVVGEVEECRR